MLTAVRTAVPRVAQPEPAPRATTFTAEQWLLAAIIALGAAIRFATIATQSYWVDEAATAHEVQLSLGALLHAVRVDETTPPLYFVVAWLWAKVFGVGEVGLRSLSALLGTGVIGLAYLCGREFVSRWAGVAAAALTAASPFMIWYSQEARAYMLLAALCALSLLFFGRALRAPSPQNIALWALASALAVLTHFFAGFLIGPEALWLLIVIRGRAIVIAAAIVAAVQGALVPLAASDTTHPLGWIKAFPLATRIQQVPIDFGLGSLYQSSIVTKGLLGAAVLAVCVLALLAVGGRRGERRGAAICAVLAAAVILVPLVLAELGRDYYVPRNMMPAWIPLAVVVGAACTVTRARAAGVVLGAVVLGGFMAAGIQIQQNPQYQRPNWRGVADALGHASAPRIVVAYDGSFAAGPLAFYLPGVSWPLREPPVVSVDELDVVAGAWQTVGPLPAGARLIATRVVDTFRVARFALQPAWRMPPAAFGVRAGTLLPPSTSGPAVLIQNPTPHR